MTNFKDVPILSFLDYVLICSVTWCLVKRMGSELYHWTWVKTWAPELPWKLQLHYLAGGFILHIAPIIMCTLKDPINPLARIACLTKFFVPEALENNTKALCDKTFPREINSAQVSTPDREFMIGWSTYTTNAHLSEPINFTGVT